MDRCSIRRLFSPAIRPCPSLKSLLLIATGIATSEFANNPDAIASRAAILLFQKIYNSVFHQKPSSDEGNSFLQNVQLDLEVTDPRPGGRALPCRIP